MPRSLLIPIGLALGAATMYLLDPAQGKRRRALLRDQLVNKSHEARAFAAVAGRDMHYGARGLIAGVRALRRRGPVPDEILIERVRAKLGRFVSHPRAIDVTADEGRVLLTGAVLASEHAKLLQCVAAVRGVTAVADGLTVHERADGIAGLQGGDPPAGAPMALMQRNWSPTARLLFTSAGGALMVYSVVRRGPIGVIALVAGAMLMRAATNRPLTEVARMRRSAHGSAAPPHSAPEKARARVGAADYAAWPEV